MSLFVVGDLALSVGVAPTYFVWHLSRHHRLVKGTALSFELRENKHQGKQDNYFFRFMLEGSYLIALVWWAEQESNL